MSVALSDWGLARSSGRLMWEGHDLTELADRFGTPLHVVSAGRLRRNARRFQNAFAAYPGEVEVYFSYKTNSIAGVLEILHREGFRAYGIDAFHLRLADALGVESRHFLLGGPNKSTVLLRTALAAGIAGLVVDTLDELERAEKAAAELGTVAQIILRVCPDIAPKGMNVSSMSGSRKSPLGLDLVSGEYEAALERVLKSSHLELDGHHAHIGSGIEELDSFRRLALSLARLHVRALDRGGRPRRVNVGGGLGARCSRELTTLEMLWYLGVGRLPAHGPPRNANLVERYGQIVSEALTAICTGRGVSPPTLALEPGRAIVSDAQTLLLSVGATRERPGVGRFAFVDGGAMSVAMMFLSELHAVLLANREAEARERVSVFGRVPTSMDVVYRGLRLPDLQPGDVLAVMDAGAYFTSTATNFGGPRPAVVRIDGSGAHLVRRRETPEDLLAVERCLEHAK